MTQCVFDTFDVETPLRNWRCFFSNLLYKKANMNIEEIKTELISEVEKMFQQKEFQLTEKDKSDKGKHVLKLIKLKLDEILENHNIEFKTNKEYEAFFYLMNPIIKELFVQFVLK